jgi:hypothetical protein
MRPMKDTEHAGELGGNSGLECFDYGVVVSRADLFDGLIRAVGPSAVGQQSNGKTARGIDPERGPGVAKMAKGVFRKIFSGLRG